MYDKRMGRASTRPPVEASQKPVLEELERVLASPDFVNAARLSRFIKYTVNEVLTGCAGGIKEYSIGLAVYDRPPEFDPKQDAIVRVEASRLRSKLDRYYANSGSGDPLRITLPKGTYVPEFIARTSADAPPRVGLNRQTLYAGVPAIVLIACALILVWRKPWTPGLPSVQAAVANDPNADSEAAQLAAQMVERLTQKLAEMRVFTVFWRGASSARADNLLRVSATRAASGLQASLSLVSARAGDQLWGETYESKSLDVLDFVDRASELAVRTVRAKFLGPRHSHRPDDEVLQLYSRGREEWAAQRRPAILKSVDFFQQALGRDPLFARAHAGLAESELFLASLLPDRAKENVERARTEATRAIELDERVPEAHAVLGNIFLWRDWNFVSAERELMRALELQPGPSAYERWYAIAAELRGHAPAALEELEFGELVNPRSETIQCEIAGALLQLGQHLQAQRKVEACLAISPGYTIGIKLAGMIQEARGDYRAAKVIYGQPLHMYETDNVWRLASLGHAEAMSGNLGEGRRILHRILSRRPQTYGRQRSLALLHLALGQTDEALAELEAANLERDVELPLIAIDPRFRQLEGNARYRALLRATGFSVPE